MQVSYSHFTIQRIFIAHCPGPLMLRTISLALGLSTYVRLHSSNGLGGGLKYVVQTPKGIIIIIIFFGH